MFQTYEKEKTSEVENTSARLEKKHWGCEAMADNVRLDGWHNGVQYGDESGTGPCVVYKMHTTLRPELIKSPAVELNRPSIRAGISRCLPQNFPPRGQFLILSTLSCK